jgi:polyisoprenoid-binding protein YceI
MTRASGPCLTGPIQTEATSILIWKEIPMSIQRTLAVLLAMLAFSAVAQAADTYKIDPVHSTALFRIQHAGAGYLYGRINGPEGTLNVDDSDPTKTSFDVTLQVKNIDTNNAQRDTHLKSPTFFSAEEFPTLTFKSTAVKAAGDNKLDVTGDLTIHGQTKSVTVTLDHTGTSNMMGNRIGYEGTFTIKRSDFGMNAMQGGVGDEVRIIISLEGVK